MKRDIHMREKRVTKRNISKCVSIYMKRGVSVVFGSNVTTVQRDIDVKNAKRLIKRDIFS